MNERLIGFGRYYRMEMSMEKSNVIRISKQTSPIQIMVDEI
jgi:hypothetical protein